VASVQVEETKQSSLFSFLQRNSSANDGNSSSAQSTGARRSAYRTFPRRKLDFAKDIAKSLTIHANKRNVKREAVQRCSTMSKHSHDKNDDFSLFYEFNISCRTLNLTILNAFPGNCVLNCRWERVATTYTTRDIDCQSFRTFIRLSTALYDVFFRMMNVLPSRLLLI